MTQEFILKNAEETKALGLKIGQMVQPGTVIALIGDLGTGKTTITKSVAEGLGIAGPITSPTFTIVCEYDDGRLPLYHFDVYRVNDEDELFEIGFDDYLNSKGVCLVEWADLIPDLMPDDAVIMNLAYGEDENQRRITIENFPEIL